MNGIADRLRDLARRVEANVPVHGDPDRFHEEKSDIADQRRAIAREARN